MRLQALVRKEALMLLRDGHALAVLFLMPALFVLLMAFAMAGINQDRLPALTLMLDTPASGDEAAFFTAALQAELPDSTLLQDSAEPVPQVRLARDFGVALLDDSTPSLSLIFPATTDAVTRQRLRGAVNVALAQTRLMAFMLDTGDLSGEETLDERLALLRERTHSRIDEQERRVDGSLGAGANATQHSVPAWLIFGMFFVILPMAHGFQSEQQSGTLMRFRCLGLNLGTLALSKLLPYLGLNLLQFVVLLALGLWGLPLLGLPALTLPGSIWPYVLLALCLACATCGLGLAIATLTRSAEQALLISGGLNIILAAIGGVMVPKSVMPEAMAQLANLSPMSWGLDAFLVLLVGGGGFTDILPYCARLLVFALLVGATGLIFFRKRLNDTQWTTQN